MVIFELICTFWDSKKKKQNKKTKKQKKQKRKEERMSLKVLIVEEKGPKV